MIITRTSDASIWEFIRLKSGIELCKFVGHSLDVSQAAFHPINNKWVVSISNDKTIRKWFIELE